MNAKDIAQSLHFALGVYRRQIHEERLEAIAKNKSGKVDKIERLCRITDAAMDEILEYMKGKK